MEVRDEGVLEPHVRSLVTGLENMVANGSVFRPDQTYGHGWMVTKVVEHERGLTLHEPDMKSWPIQFVRGVSETVRHMTKQLFTLDSFGIPREEMDIPTILHSAVVCRRYHESEELVLVRGNPEERDSGWSIACRGTDHDHQETENLANVSLYQVLLTRPEVVSWMTFPIDSLILLQPNQRPRVLRGDTELSIQPNTMPHKVYEQQ